MNRNVQFALSEEAALWVVRLGEDPAATRRAEFFEWVRQSPRHMEEFMFATTVSRQLEGMNPQKKMTVDWAILHSLAEEPDIAPAPAPARIRSDRRRRAVSLAASVAAGILGWALFASLSGGTQTYVTHRGDQRAVKLGDGSLMELNTSSRAAVTYSDTERRIHLLEGEALFSVERDPSRPFFVQADDAVVQVIGTRFNVYRHPQGLRVSVVEGLVLVSLPNGESLQLVAGTEAHLVAGHITAVPDPDIRRALSWQSRRLVFHSDRLEDVAHEFNRYNRRQIQLKDPRLADRPISGVFDADDTQPLVEFLSRYPEFDVREWDDRIEIGRR